MSRIIPPWISTVRNGKDVVILGNHEYPVDSSKPPVFFLPTYLEARIPGSWVETQQRLPQSERHPLANWMIACSAFVAAFELRGNDAEYKDILTPHAKAMLILAYDMYFLDGNRTLQDSLIRRLIGDKSFQGARYEAAVAATMLRAGFDIAYEDESDSSRKHPEFLATHSRSKARIAVEAKSIHRSGVLGFENGNPPPTIETGSAHKIAAQVCGQIEVGLRKASEVPFYIFVELNLPGPVAHHFAPSLFDEFQDILPQIDHGIDANGVCVGKTINLVTVTNWPMLLGEDTPRGRDTLALFVDPSREMCRFPEGSDHVVDVKEAVKNYGTVSEG